MRQEYGCCMISAHRLKALHAILHRNTTLISSKYYFRHESFCTFYLLNKHKLNEQYNFKLESCLF